MTAERVSDETETRPEGGLAEAALRARYLDLWEANLSAWARAAPPASGDG